MWGHLKRDDEKFEEFTKENRLMEVLYSNNRESRVKWNTLAFHVLSLLPITEFLFSNVGFVKEQKRPWRVIARAARLALMAEEVGFIDVISLMAEEVSFIVGK
ncbi:hypothetical protein HN51_011002 [Arachis hypogaea]